MCIRSLRLMPLFGAVFASLALASTACAASHYDVVNDFRVKSNPNGLWTYMDQAPLTQAHHSFEGVAGLENWSNGLPNGVGVLIARNKTGQTVVLENGTLTFPANYLLIDTQSNPGSIVQFQAPVAGSYTIKGDFFHLDSDQGRDVGIGVYLGTYQTGTQLFARYRLGRKHQKFDVTTAMQAGQTLQFYVTASPTEKPNYVGLQAKITGP